jgi:hypothetical protein
MSSVHATVTLKKWGNRIGLVLPAQLAKAVHLFSGTQVEIDVSEESLVVLQGGGPVTPKPSGAARNGAVLKRFSPNQTL